MIVLEYRTIMMIKDAAIFYNVPLFHMLNVPSLTIYCYSVTSQCDVTAHDLPYVI